MLEEVWRGNRGHGADLPRDESRAAPAQREAVDPRRRVPFCQQQNLAGCRVHGDGFHVPRAVLVPEDDCALDGDGGRESIPIARRLPDDVKPDGLVMAAVVAGVGDEQARLAVEGKGGHCLPIAIFHTTDRDAAMGGAILADCVDGRRAAGVIQRP